MGTAPYGPAPCDATPNKILIGMMKLTLNEYKYDV